MIEWGVMRKICLLLLSLFLLSVGSGTTARVVIIDTGLDVEDPRFKDILCKDVQALDFTGEGVVDKIGHGTHVAGIIKEYAKDSNYCLTIIKYYTEENSGKQNLSNVIEALKWVHLTKPKIVNFSGGGETWDNDEYEYIKNTPETTFILAAGNKRHNLDEDCDYYPACNRLKNIIRVGSLQEDGKRAYTSNFGKIVTAWEIGTNVKSTLPDGRTGFKSGTSQATAKITGKFIYEIFH
jgi:subtilisin family serine protease